MFGKVIHHFNNFARLEFYYLHMLQISVPFYLKKVLELLLSLKIVRAYVHLFQPH